MKKQILLRMMDSRPYEYFTINIIPYIRFSMYYTSFKGIDYHRGYNLLQPGDIILTRDKWKFTTFLIPGLWSHAALCVSKNGKFEVAEMTHNNYTQSTFFDICKESTRVAIIRCRDWDEDYISRVIEKCKSFKDAKYDVKFDHDVKALYCSELIVASDFEKRLQVSDEDIECIGRKYISPTGLSKARNIDVIFDSSI